MIPLFLFLSYIVHLLILFLSLRTVPLEHPPPKHSFPSMYMLYMVPLSCSHLPYMDVPFVSCIASMQPHLFYRTAQLTLYTCLSQSTTDTAWSVHHVPTYLNDDTPCIFSNLNLLDLPL